MCPCRAAVPRGLWAIAPTAMPDQVTVWMFHFPVHPMSLGTILLIVLILAVLGLLPTWSHSANFGYGPSGVVGVIALIVVVLLLTGRL